MIRHQGFSCVRSDHLKLYISRDIAANESVQEAYAMRDALDTRYSLAWVRPILQVNGYDYFVQSISLVGAICSQ